jgi:thiamine-monophosphate kinase
MKLRDLGEDRLLARLLPRLKLSKAVRAGPGDDCAVLRFPGTDKLLLFKTDCLVETVHFRPSDDADAVGWKAMMRPLSDFAAMSGMPQFALITLIAPNQTTVRKIDNLYRGLQRAAARFDVSIVGGETSVTRGPMVISVSVVGFVEKKRWVARRGGKAGDDLYVTGRLGGADKGKHLRFVPRIAEARWLTKNFRVHAMMDLSDGLGADLPRLAKASKVGYKIDKKTLPLAPGAKIDNAISDGEDYELLFAISPRERKHLQQSWRKRFPKLPLTRIGCLSQLPAAPKQREGGSTINSQPLRRGYIHFK